MQYPTASSDLFPVESNKCFSWFAKAIRSVPLIYVNQIGANDNLIFDGNSFILDKNGSKIKQLKSFSEDLSSWDIEQTIPEKNKLNQSEISSIFDALVLGVRDYAKKCGFKTALIGLSGGIDSALVSAIATAALGSNNIYCVSMPSKWSSSHSKSDARDLARRLKINFNSIPIENLMSSFEAVSYTHLTLPTKRIV